MAKHTQKIERKWVVRDLPKLGGLKHDQIIQGYLAISCDGAEVRIRRKGNTCFLESDEESKRFCPPVWFSPHYS
jgi:hypothetical protein